MVKGGYPMRLLSTITILAIALGLSSTAHAQSGLLKLMAPKYWVEIYTGACEKSGTRTHLTFTLHGNKGTCSSGGGIGNSTTTRYLSHKVPFGTLKHNAPVAILINNCDKDLGYLRAITVASNPFSQSKGPGWFCEKLVVVKEQGDKKTRWRFPCHRWLSAKSDDKKMKRTFPEHNFVTYYQVTVDTGSKKNAGTDGRVRISLEGSKRELRSFQLSAEGDNHERYMTDIYPMVTKDLGKLKKLHVSLEKKGKGAGWFLEKITVRRKIGKTYKAPVVFRFNRWFSKKHGWDGAATPAP